MHYGVKGMKWRHHKLQFRSYDNEEEDDSKVYEVEGKNRLAFATTFKDKKYGNIFRVGVENKKKQQEYDGNYKHQSKSLSKRITKYTDNFGRTYYDVDLGNKKQRVKSKSRSVGSHASWRVNEGVMNYKRAKKKK